mmetsp:Transcript_1862/g.1939  ORF Transcript_1862/g.1939 Transcript_1862/m.1939 type:complete len:800 (+) Transcript_1862:122-2521(+)
MGDHGRKTRAALVASANESLQSSRLIPKRTCFSSDGEIGCNKNSVTVSPIAKRMLDDDSSLDSSTLRKIQRRQCANNRRDINHLSHLPEVCLYRIFSFFITPKSIDFESFNSIQSMNKYFHEAINSSAVWYHIPIISPNGNLNIDSFKLRKKKCQGTEGKCFHVYHRPHQREYALKRARVQSESEGVPYYMMRELSALKQINHPNICELELISLRDFRLYLLFPYVEHTLHDFLNPSGEPNTGIPLPHYQVHDLCRQLLGAVAHLHRRGIMHRNLKPKHILIIPGRNTDNPLDGAQVKLADFALVRILGHNPTKKFTTEVITLWYRPPEILMGQKEYTASVDIWSLGCIFAEMLEGKPLFTGLCEIDQLFQIFYKMGTPTGTSWPAFPHLPHYQECIFPQWLSNQLRCHVSNATEIEYDFLSKLLRFEPSLRMAAHEAITHPCLTTSSSSSFSSSSSSFSSSSSSSSSSSQSYTVKERILKHNSNLSNSYFDEELDRNEMQLKYTHKNLINMHATAMRQYCFLRQLECTSRLPRGALNPGNNVDSSMQAIYTSRIEGRAELVDWIIEILDVFNYHMCSRTAYFAVAVVDRYLNSLAPLIVNTETDIEEERSHEDRLRLLGATCLHVASKCEDVSYIGINDLATQMSEHSIYEPREILEMEELVLNTLEFNVYIPTVIDFVGFFAESIPEIAASPVVQSCLRYISEMSLLHNNLLCFDPSLVATASVFLALHLADLNAWPDTVQIFSGYTMFELRDCIQILWQVHHDMPQANVSMVYQRYLRQSNHEVALWLTKPLPVLL